ncbi:MAG: hypothetical protein ACRYHA_32545 [Janthinobacterium lividum]
MAGLVHRHKPSHNRQDERHRTNNQSAACASFNALFDAPALQDARRRDEAALARAAAIAEIRAKVEEYGFEEAELGFQVRSA